MLHPVQLLIRTLISFLIGAGAGWVVVHAQTRRQVMLGMVCLGAVMFVWVIVPLLR